MKSYPYLINHDSTGEPLRAIDPRQAPYKEDWLQEMLRIHPEILPVAEIEPEFFQLIPIGWEVPVSAGYIDILFITPHGKLVLVETKLWHNPEARREVVAQSIDYASTVVNWKINELDQITRKYTGRYEGNSYGLLEWIKVFAPGSSEVDTIDFEGTVSRNLQTGKFLILLVGDRIRTSVVEMIDYINKYPQIAMNIALIELQCFNMGNSDEWPLIVLPSIIAKTKTVERTIIEINTLLDGISTLQVTQENLSEVDKNGRSALTEDEYWERLKDRNHQAVPTVRKIVEHFRVGKGITIKPREKSIAIHLYIPENGQRISLFFIRTDGVIECWHNTIVDQLINAEMDIGLKNIYVRELSEILHYRTETQSIYDSAEKVDPVEFTKVVDKFVDSILRAVSELGD